MSEKTSPPQHDPSWHEVAPAQFWEERYAGRSKVWSGRVNATLASVATDLAPGRALDLGCGEGADVVWLAERGWRATGIDISRTAIERATAAARERGLTEEQARFLAADLSALPTSEPFDLVTASFLHSPVDLPRGEILKQAADLVAPGGHLLITSHAAPPPWADTSAHEHRFPTVEEEIAQLDLDQSQWERVVAEVRKRTSVGPDGLEAELDDVVVLLRRSDI